MIKYNTLSEKWLRVTITRGVSEGIISERRVCGVQCAGAVIVCYSAFAANICLFCVKLYMNRNYLAFVT